MKIVNKQLVSLEHGDVKKGILRIPKSVTSIADQVIIKNSEIEKVIGLGVTSIGNDNFRYCNALTSVDFPLVTSIGNGNFYECNALTSVDFPLVTSIGNYNFRYCNALTSVDFPLVTSIGNYNFRYCNALTSVDFPLVTSIGKGNFYECNALTSVDFPLVTSIGNYNFYECNALTSVEFKNKKLKVKSVDGYLFVIEKSKSTKGIIVYTGYNLFSFDKNNIEKENCFLAEKDNFYAHGETIKKAISDVQFKAITEKLKNEPILPDTMITVMYYRTVTGACELGCKDFINRNNLEKEEYRADELLPILEKNNAYGVEKFKSLINW